VPRPPSFTKLRARAPGERQETVEHAFGSPDGRLPRCSRGVGLHERPDDRGRRLTWGPRARQARAHRGSADQTGKDRAGTRAWARMAGLRLIRLQLLRGSSSEAKGALRSGTTQGAAVGRIAVGLWTGRTGRAWGRTCAADPCQRGLPGSEGRCWKPSAPRISGSPAHRRRWTGSGNARERGAAPRGPLRLTRFFHPELGKVTGQQVR